MFRFVLLFAMTLSAQDKPRPRLFVTDSNSWQMGGGFTAASVDGTGAAGGRFSGGARGQTVEVIKNFNEKCPAVTVTVDRSKASYVVLFDHEGGKGHGRKDNKIAVFKGDGDMVHSSSTRSLGNAVKNACEAIQKDAGGN